MATKYKYSNVKDLTTISGDYNFYGIIYDATFPSVDETPNTYVCTVKVIDSDVNCLTFPNSLNDEVVNVIIKSNSKENLPYIHNIGDIIRIHRGYYVSGFKISYIYYIYFLLFDLFIFQKPKKKKNVYLNLTNISKLKASWCIFTGASDINNKEHTPIACSSSNYTFEAVDRQKIDNLRAWIKLYFKEKKSLFFGKEAKLIDRMNPKNTFGSTDNDVLLQIIFKTELDDKIVYFVQDETDGCELHALKYFNFIEVNDVIRLRSYKVFDK